MRNFFGGASGNNSLKVLKEKHLIERLLSQILRNLTFYSVLKGKVLCEQMD